jgi:hypothetical protein
MKPFFRLSVALLSCTFALHATPLDDVQASLNALKAQVNDLQNRINALASTPPVPVASATPPPPPASNGQVTVNGYTYGSGVPPMDGRVNGGPPQTVRNGNKEIWVAARGDGKAGAGTAADPFDASSQAKWDALNGRYKDNTTWHIAKGRYKMSGGNNVHPNQQFFGAGMLDTVLVNGTGAQQFSPNTQANVDNFQLFDCTLDTSDNGTRPYGGGFCNNGNGFLLERVRFTKWGTNRGESFVAFSFGYLVSGGDNNNVWHDDVIDRCIFDQPIKSTDGTTIDALGAVKHQGAFDQSCKITRCYFGPGIAGNFTYSHGPQAPETAFNTINDVATGCYLEPEDWAGGKLGNEGGIDVQTSIIHDNLYLNVFQGFNAQWTHRIGQLAGRYEFSRNTIDNRNYQGGYNAMCNVSTGTFAQSDMPNQPLVSSFAVDGNTYYGAGKGGDVPMDWSGPNLTANQVTITNNKITYSPAAGAAFRINKARIKSFTSNGNTVNGQSLNP